MTQIATGTGASITGQTLQPGRGYVLTVSMGYGATVALPPTAVTGFTVEGGGSIATANGNLHLSVWRRVVTATTTGTITITPDGTQDNIRWSLYEVTGADTGGVNGANLIRRPGGTPNIAVVATAALTPSVTLPFAVASGNAVFSAIAYNAATTQTITPGTGYVKVGVDVTASGSPANQLSGELDTTGTTLATWGTTNGSNKAVVAFEIAEATATPPTADAGADQAVETWETVTLTGSASGGTGTKTPAWTVVSGAPPGFALVGASTFTPSFEAPGGPDGYTIVLRLTVTDGAAMTATDDVTVTVQPWGRFILRGSTWTPARRSTRRGSTWVE